MDRTVVIAVWKARDRIVVIAVWKARDRTVVIAVWKAKVIEQCGNWGYNSCHCNVEGQG